MDENQNSNRSDSLDWNNNDSKWTPRLNKIKYQYTPNYQENFSFLKHRRKSSCWVGSWEHNSVGTILGIHPPPPPQALRPPKVSFPRGLSPSEGIVLRIGQLLSTDCQIKQLHLGCSHNIAEKIRRSLATVTSWSNHENHNLATVYSYLRQGNTM